ncbi:hypothetical protein CP973_09795 [Streptomyces albofaciens JCM 4342]|uniref:hypothetical protein n=1 Tax=Streptomyces albofaciens TaxID=66866 RepID=UPI0012394B71|nr:hypothetical protein [Streptomyces albofaciens]KAA6222200.1 hypothetical protein CP973_09795 [Streptomyces albofaciens JCM 4342]
MTACVTEDAATPDTRPHPAALTIAADGSYAARLARHESTGNWFPERWTLAGPEPYAVPLPGHRPEEADTRLLPLADGRVLIRRRAADRHALGLLYPTGPGTGELPLGTVEAAELTLLPAAPCGSRAYALAPGERSTVLWLVHDGHRSPVPGQVRTVPACVAEIEGRCTGGVWLDRTGRLLALDQELDGRTKTVAVDLERGGEVSPLLQITEESNDRLLLADPDSGLLVLRSDAAGHDRLGWGVLGSALPVRFPECLRLPDAALRPFAVQPGQALAPESSAVAFRIDAVTGTWLGVWRPAERRLRQLPAPRGWLAGTGLWTADGELRLPCVTPAVPCGLARLPASATGARSQEESEEPVDAPSAEAGPGADAPAPAGALVPAGVPARPARWIRVPSTPPSATAHTQPPPPPPADAFTASAQAESMTREPFGVPAHPSPYRPVPLQQAPLQQAPAAAREAR